MVIWGRRDVVLSSEWDFYIILVRRYLYIKSGPWSSKWPSKPGCRGTSVFCDNNHGRIYLLDLVMYFPKKSMKIFSSLLTICAHTLQACDYLSMLILKLIHISKKGLCYLTYPLRAKFLETHTRFVLYFIYHKIFNISAPNPKTKIILVSSCSCLRPIHWSKVLSRLHLSDQQTTTLKARTVDARKEEVFFPDLLITLRRHGTWWNKTTLLIIALYFVFFVLSGEGNRRLFY